MKIVTILLWLAALIVGALLLGRITGERSLARAEAQAEQTRLAEQRRVGEKLARLVRASDEVLIVTDIAGGEETGQRFHDSAWNEVIARILEEAPYGVTSPGRHGLWFSFPYIRFHTTGQQTLSLMMSGSTLRVLGIEGLGDILVGPETITALNQAWLANCRNSLVLPYRPQKIGFSPSRRLEGGPAGPSDGKTWSTRRGTCAST